MDDTKHVFQWERAQRLELEWWVAYNQKAPSFDQPGTRRFPAYLEAFREHFSADSILDVGCGPFPLLIWLKDCRRRVALDPLNTKYATSGFYRDAGIEYLNGVAEAMPFADAEVDQVIMFNMLDHMEDWQGAVREALRVARTSVLVHTHVEGPYVGGGLHRNILETEAIEFFEKKLGGLRLRFCYPKKGRPLWRRLASELKLRVTGQGGGFHIKHEPCWAGILRKNTM